MNFSVHPMPHAYPDALPVDHPPNLFQKSFNTADLERLGIRMSDDSLEVSLSIRRNQKLSYYILR